MSGSKYVQPVLGSCVTYLDRRVPGEWCEQTMRSRIEPMKKMAKMLRVHRDLILNYFKAKKVMSSGAVEGLNNKPQSP